MIFQKKKKNLVEKLKKHVENGILMKMTHCAFLNNEKCVFRWIGK